MRFLRVFLVVAALAAVFVPTALALRFTDESYFIPVGVVGQPYSHQFGGASGCGPALPYQYRILGGSLPPGLTLSKDGRVSGIPTAAGTWNVWIELSDENPPSAAWCRPETAEREFQFVIQPGMAIMPTSAPPATIGAAYSLGLSAEGAGSATTWSISGQLPPGLTFSGTAITGTPTTAGSYSFTVQAVDGRRNASRNLTIAVRPALAVQPPAVRPAEVGVALTGIKVVATGGSGTYTWRLEGGLPAGLAFDAQTAEISGTPTAAGTFAVKIVATDSEGRVSSADARIVVRARLAITTKRLVFARVGSFYVANVKTRGGVGPMRVRSVGGRFPVGLRLNVRTGLLTGKPRVAGIYRFTIQVRDALGVTATKTFVLNVRARA